MSNSLWPHGLQHTRLLCPSLSPGVCSNSLSRWCYLTFSSSAALFFCLQSFPASGSFPVSQLFTSGEDFLGGSDSKASVYNVGDLGLIPGLGRSSGEGNGNPLQYSCLENPMDGEAWYAIVHGVAKSWTRLSNFTFTSGGQMIGASAPVLSMNTQGLFPLGLTGLIFLQSRGLSRVFSNTTIRKHQFFST